MIRNKSFIDFICAISIAIALLVSITGRVIPAYALAAGPLAEPIYDTEIIAFKDYVEQNLDTPQLDIMFFLIGGLAVAQMGAQDAMLVSPYPNEESVKEWIINCGIQLYNSVIGLVPEGDYYMGITSIGADGIKGVPRQVIKALVAQMMGDAVVAANYTNLDDFIEDNPDKILLPFNADLQLGVNAIFGLNGGLYDWQFDVQNFKSNITYKTVNLTGLIAQEYLNIINSYPDYGVRFNTDSYYYESGNGRCSGDFYLQYHNLFIDYPNHQFYLTDDNGDHLNYYDIYESSLIYALKQSSSSSYELANFPNVGTRYVYPISYDSSLYSSVVDLVQAIYDMNFSGTDRIFFEDFIKHIYYGSSWDDKIEIFKETNLNLSDSLNGYYSELTTDYLFDLRGLMGDLVNYVYLNPIWDNIYDLVGTIVTPDRVKVSVDLTPITDLLAPAIPVNLNDIDLYTDNDYLNEIKERSTKFGETLGEYFVFWHNSDPMTVYVIFGSVIVILIGAFIGKWGHS